MIIKFIQVVLLAFLISFSIFAQAPIDSNVVHLDNVEIKGYFKPQSLSSSTLAAFIIDKKQIETFDQQSLVPVFNSVPGVRMEERSPASYRLSIRGSLLRSPFGVRDVKVYLADLPLTDAGGNTYLNSISLTALNNVEILKGPDGSVFGANSGGVVLLDPVDKSSDSSKVILGIQGGSYASGLQSLSLKQQVGKHNLQFNQSFQTAGGYRENSAMSRLYFQVYDNWTYAKRKELSIFLLHSRLNYQTPGGLTLAQYETHPQWARQATNTLPGAIEQKAGIGNNLTFGGLTHKIDIRPGIKNIVSVFGSYADFKNPFITNYETRAEKTIGTRFYFTFSGDKMKNVHFWEYSIGFEGQVTNSDIKNFDNLLGEKGNLQSSDEIKSYQYFVFNHLKLDFTNRFFVEASASLNFAGYQFPNKLDNDFHPQWMPRLALNYRLIEDILSFRALVSRGFSAPTTAEIRPSDNRIYANLLPEKGWNYESGLRLTAFGNKMWVDVSAFYYHLQQAIVRRENQDGTEYFINSGGTVQPGIETYVQYKFIPNRSANSILSNFSISGSYTLNFFRFQDYLVKNQDFSGNQLTGVPKQVFFAMLTAGFKTAFSLSLMYNYTDKIPLNDANSVYSSHYNLLSAKVSKKLYFLKTNIIVFAAADNLLNQKYSLGNDLNAFGGRYYNAAALRNFTIGVQLQK